MKGELYLIPCTLGETSLERSLPADNIEIIKRIKHFIVEDVRTARRFLKKCDREIDINALCFYELNKHTDSVALRTYLDTCDKGEPMGVISEAGCPAIADPGSTVVAQAHEKGIRVIPLVGPSSILLALMGSGFNGQGFSFHGYLPIESSERPKKIKELEGINAKTGYAQIFIETPFRNMKLLEDLVGTCSPNTRLCIAADLTLETESIRTQTILAWRTNKENYHKRAAIFIIG